MSHFTTVKTEIKDFSLLKETLTSLGYLDIKENDIVRGYQGNKLKADLVVKMPNGYDIGFIKEGDGCKVIADFWGTCVRQEEFIKELSQKYAYQLIKREAMLQGFQVVEEVNREDGTIKLVVQKWV